MWHMIFRIPKNVCKNICEKLLEWVNDAGHDFRLLIFLIRVNAKYLQPQKMGTHCLSGFPRFFVYSHSRKASIYCEIDFFIAICCYGFMFIPSILLLSMTFCNQSATGSWSLQAKRILLHHLLHSCFIGTIFLHKYIYVFPCAIESFPYTPSSKE